METLKKLAKKEKRIKEWEIDEIHNIIHKGIIKSWNMDESAIGISKEIIDEIKQLINN